MVIIGKISFPPQSIKEFSDAYLKVPPLPDYMEIKGQYFRTAEEKGVKVISIFGFDALKLSESIEYVHQRFGYYFHVPGLNTSIEVWLEPDNDLKNIGLF